MPPPPGPQNPTQRLQDGEGWATGRHQFLITLLLVGRLCSAFPHLGFGVPCWCGVGGPRPGGSALLVAGFVHWVII